MEYAYSRMAVASGIRMAETHLLIDGEFAHFMTRRFDRVGPEGRTRLHLHSLGGLLHLDYLNQYQIGYEDYFDAMRALGLPQPAVEEGFLRMVFHLATVNYDDHLKNFAFLMDAFFGLQAQAEFDRRSIVDLLQPMGQIQHDQNSRIEPDGRSQDRPPRSWSGWSATSALVRSSPARESCAAFGRRGCVHRAPATLS